MAGYHDSYGEFHLTCPDCSEEIGGDPYTVRVDYQAQAGHLMTARSEPICYSCAYKREAYWRNGGHHTSIRKEEL